MVWEAGKAMASERDSKRESFLKILTVRGIDIRVHITFPLLLIYVAWSGISGPVIHPERILIGVVTILLLFVIVTLHELGHSLEALRLGGRVSHITLYPIGGVAGLERMPSNPWYELRITVAGPMVNFVLAGLLWLLDQALQSAFPGLGSGGPFGGYIVPNSGGLLSMLVAMNLILGMFNLVPAFPLDGGRIFRALLALRLDYVRATTIAARLGQGIAVLVAISIFLPGSGAGLISEMWRLFLAVLVFMGAQGELKHVSRRRGTARRTAGEVMIREAAVLATHVSLTSAREFMGETEQPIFPVLDDFGRPVGWVTPDMVESGLAVRDSGTRIGQIMLESVEYVGEQTPMQEAIELMIERQYPALAVVEADGRLKGILIANLAIAPGPPHEPSLN